MTQVPISEIVEALRAYDKAMVECGYKLAVDKTIADRIETHGIAPPDGWVSIEAKRPYIGQVVILCLNGVVQEETYTYDQGDNGMGVGEYFWFRADVDNCPVVTDSDQWMPLPAAAPKQEVKP